MDSVALDQESIHRDGLFAIDHDDKPYDPNDFSGFLAAPHQKVSPCLFKFFMQLSSRKHFCKDICHSKCFVLKFHASGK